MADAAKEVFVTFYDRLMPPLKYILRNTDNEQCKVAFYLVFEIINCVLDSSWEDDRMHFSYWIGCWKDKIWRRCC